MTSAAHNFQLALLAVCVALAAPARAEVFSEHDSKLYMQAIKLDQNADAPFPANIPDAYHSTFGTQIHPTCFDYSKAVGMTRDQAEHGMERTLLEALEAVVNCQTKYPELQPYLSQWIHLFRRTRFACLSDTQAQRHFGAENVASAWDLQRATSSRERSGIKVDSEFSPFEAPVVLLPRDSFTAMASGQSGESGIDTVIHEILHSTDANNRWDHDPVERKGPGVGGKCATDNVSTDRINVISTLCSNARLSGGPEGTPAILFKRMSDCGARSCESFFARDFYESNLANNLERPWTPAEGLGGKAAGSLCARIYDEGQCRYDLAQQGEELLKGNKVLKELGQRLRARLNALFVPKAARLDPEVLAAASEERDALLAERDGACFKSVFQVSVKGAVSVPTGSAGISPNPPEPGLPSTPELAFKRSIDAMRAAVQSSPACAGDGAASAEKIKSALTDVDLKIRPVFGRRAYLSMIEPRYLGRAERIAKPDESGASLERLRTLVGPALYDHYLAEVEPRHWASESVDCAKLGYSPEGRLRGGFKALENATPRQQRECH